MKQIQDEPFQAFDIETHWLINEEKRFDASFYARDVIASRVLIGELENKGIEVKRLDDLSDKIFWPGRFKRKYASKKDGSPFLMPSEVIMLLPKAKKFIRDYPENVSINENWLLITRSGTVGRCLITTKVLKDSVLSDDLIRVAPKDENHVGYIYSYLNSWIGQAFLTKDRYGSTVKHIEPHHVGNIQLPRIPELEQATGRKIIQAQKLREEAQKLLLTAEDLLHSKLKLPKIDEDDIQYFGKEDGRTVKAFEIKASELNLRLDASYHTPIIRQIEKNLEQINLDVQPLENKISSIFIPPRFKRSYVRSPNHGIRYLRPSDLSLIKYFEHKYLAKTFNNCGLYRLKEGEILVVTDGTIGWASIVTPEIVGWYGSNNFARIVPGDNLDKGYLLGYILSPYGQYQLKREIYGGVIDHLTEDQILQMKIPLPSKEIQESIGNLVLDAYDKRDEASKLEDEAVIFLEKKLKEIAEETRIREYKSASLRSA